MREEFKIKIVSYEQAQKLKKLGYDWTHKDSCCKWYYPEPDGNIMIMDSSFTDKSLAAPPVGHALKWFRDVKNIQNGVKFLEYFFEDKHFLYYVGKFQNQIAGEFSEKDVKADTYDDAESALLDELLTLNF
jgi:hypothetical protein